MKMIRKLYALSLYDMIWYDKIRNDILYDTTYLLTEIGLPPGGSSTVHIYTQTVHRTTQNKQCIEQYKNVWKNSSVSSLTPWSRVLLEKLTGSQLITKFPAFYGTRMFITVFTSVRHVSLSWDSSIQSTFPHPTSRRSILILSSHLRLGWAVSLRFPQQNPVCKSALPHSATCPAHLILLYFITRTILGEEYRSLSSSLCIFLHSCVTSFLLGPNILLSNLFSKTLSRLMCTLNGTLDPVPSWTVWRSETL
jgi:hypothetical protein